MVLLGLLCCPPRQCRQKPAFISTQTHTNMHNFPAHGFCLWHGYATLLCGMPLCCVVHHAGDHKGFCRKLQLFTTSQDGGRRYIVGQVNVGEDNHISIQGCQSHPQVFLQYAHLGQKRLYTQHLHIALKMWAKVMERED